MALERVIPSIKNEKVEKGGYLVIRPDSGDPKEVVLMGLRAGEKVFGAEVNSKGYKRLIGCGVIQGDGVQIDVIQKARPRLSLARFPLFFFLFLFFLSADGGRAQLTQAVLEAGYAANNVVYGMGGALLQRVDRDTMSFATKLNYIEYADGTKHDVMKKPRSDSGKISLPGVLQVRRVNGIPTVFPADPDGPRAPDNLLRVVYDRRPLLGVWDDFETVRKRARTEWKALPQVHDPISAELKEKIKNWIANHKLVYD
jgi:nicotinamide phosphoribosyltransferase